METLADEKLVIMSEMILHRINRANTLQFSYYTIYFHYTC